MKLQALKKNLIKVIIISTICITVAGFIAFLCSSYVSSFEEDLDIIKSQIWKINQEAEDSENDFKGLTEASKSYNNIHERRRPTKTGFRNSTERRRALTQIESKIKEKYYLSYFETELEGRPEVDLDYTLEYADIYSNNVTFSFGALTDEIVHAVVKDIIGEMPGYVQLKSISVENKIPFSDNILSRINNGEINIGLVEAIAKFKWTTLKKINKKKKR